MPSISDHQSSVTTKMLILGESGAGKSGGLCSLAQAGYNVRVLDYDNGLDIVANLLRAGRYGKEAASRFHYVTLTDQMKSFAGKMVPKKATAWNRGIKMLEDWKELGEVPLKEDGTPTGEPAPTLVDFGPITTWTPKDVLVIDSLSFMANAAMNWVLSLNGALGGPIEQSHWYGGQQLVEKLLQMLYDESVQCNVIVNAHIQYMEGDGKLTRGLPQSLGRALSPKIGRYFNNVIMARTAGTGGNEKHRYYTGSTALVELKASNPVTVKAEYSVETGLAEIFQDLRGGK